MWLPAFGWAAIDSVPGFSDTAVVTGLSQPTDFDWTTRQGATAWKTGPTAPGHLTLFAGGAAAPAASTMNFRPGQTRANNAILPLGVLGDVSVQSALSSGGVHFIVDVNGYFE